MKITRPDLIARKRRSLGYTQTDLANLTGVTQQYISMLESGTDRDCSETLALKIARRLEIDLEDAFEHRDALHVAPVTRSKVGTKSWRPVTA